jgi:hypothetical protein
MVRSRAGQPTGRFSMEADWLVTGRDDLNFVPLCPAWVDSGLTGLWRLQ